MNLPPELIGKVLGYLSCLEDLRSFSLTNRLMAGYVRNIEAKTLWWITTRSVGFNCGRHADGLCWCGTVVPALEQNGSRPWKVRAWLCRRASTFSFGRSEESLAGCQVPVVGVKPPHDTRRRQRLELDVVESDEEEAKEWDVVWLTFARYLTQQRVQRVNVGDSEVRPEWRREYWQRWDDEINGMSVRGRTEAARSLERETWQKQRYGRTSMRLVASHTWRTLVTENVLNEM